MHVRNKHTQDKNQGGLVCAFAHDVPTPLIDIFDRWEMEKNFLKKVDPA